MKKIFLILLLLGFIVRPLFSAPDNTLSISPSATSGATITASDENTRNNTISTVYNAHGHTDISQTGNSLNIGDATAGNKTIYFNNADDNKPYFQFNDTDSLNWFVLSENGVMASLVLHGNAAIFEGTTDDAYETTLSITDPTADRTITIPDNSGTVALLGVAQTWSAAQYFNSGNVGIGTTAPVKTLDVVGTANITGDVGIGGTMTLTTLLADSNIAPITTASKVNTSALYGTTYLPDATVDTTALKSTYGEVSVTTSSNKLLPGGAYGFYPQVYWGGVGNVGVGLYDSAYVGGDTMTTSPLTFIGFRTTGGATVGARQTYVTASGTDLWVFLLIDKSTKEINSAWQAPDHPAYGNGGDFEKILHPFVGYNPEKEEIILVDKETCEQLKLESKITEKSIIYLVNNEYKPDMSKTETYQPLHSGKFINEDGKQVKQLVRNIPDYIKVRKLIRLTQEEKDANKEKQKQRLDKYNQEQEKKEEYKVSAKNKLKALEFNDDEIEAIIK